jgi:formylglycine-generating enzyme required for sulfatase activity
VTKEGPADLGWKKFAQCPALRMTVREAYEFGQWLGGRLPTTRQWNKASGYAMRDGSKGPFRVPAGRKETKVGEISLPEMLPGEIAINRGHVGPMKVGEATCDESLYHCRDMAGNGREWTRDLAGFPPRFVPLENPGPDDTVILRGQRYDGKIPWLFRKVDQNELELGKYLVPSPYFGFRVVIELN